VGVIDLERKAELGQAVGRGDDGFSVGDFEAEVVDRARLPSFSMPMNFNGGSATTKFA